MAKVDQSLEQIEKLLSQVQGIAANLQKARGSMVDSGAATIEIDVSTAVRYLDWLEEWGEKVQSAGRRAAKKKEAEDFHMRLERKKKPASK